MTKQYMDIGEETLAYLEEGRGETIVFLHGNLSSSVHFTPLIEQMRGSFHCVAPDMRGFGDSSYNRGFDSIDELAEDIRLFMDKMDIASAYVAGWSAGGAVAMKLAAMYPEKVRKLFLIEGAGFQGYPVTTKDENLQPAGKPYADKASMADDPVSVASAVKIIEEKDSALMSAVWQQTIYTVSAPDPEDNRIWINETLKQRNLPDLVWALSVFNMSDEPGIYGQGDNSIHKITCPVALTSGDKDVVVPPFMVQANANALGEHTKLISYENCGHSPLVDCPDRLASDIADFFGQSRSES